MSQHCGDDKGSSDKMASEKLSCYNRVTASNGVANKDTNDVTAEKASKNDLSSPPKTPDNTLFILGCLIYFTYYMSITVDSQFLSLYYKSKGFDGSTIGWLYSLTPLTTFLMVPFWSMLTAVEGDGKHGSADSGNNINANATKRQIQILYLSIFLATASQVSLAVLDTPVYMMVVIIIAGIFQSPAKPLLDGLMMDHLDDRSKFGKVRVFSNLGSGFGTTLGGWLLSMVKESILNDGQDQKSIRNYLWNMPSGFSLLFVARLILTIPPILLINKLNTKASTKFNKGKIILPSDTAGEQNSDKDSNPPSEGKDRMISFASMARSAGTHYFSDTNHLLFFTCIYIAGASGGVSDAFSYLRYQESGCSTTHMGQSRLLSSAAGAVMFWYSGHISIFLGIQNVIVLSLMCTGARFSLLRFMDRPYYAYLVDLIRGTTYGAFWSSSTIYGSQIGPASLRATTLLLLNGIYNGIGRSSGAILGGEFVALFGTNELFLWCSRINYAMAITMAILYYHQDKNTMKHGYGTTTTKKLK